MNNRLWYPQLDVYDGIRRLGLLLITWCPILPPLERLYISDFYLANPPLLHHASMPRAVRKTFQYLQIARPGTTFLNYPAPQLLYHKMEPIQKSALRAMAGKGIVDVNSIRLGKVGFTQNGAELLQKVVIESSTEEEIALVNFLTTEFASISPDDSRDFRNRTVLKRIV